MKKVLRDVIAEDFLYVLFFQFSHFCNGDGRIGGAKYGRARYNYVYAGIKHGRKICGTNTAVCLNGDVKPLPCHFRL